MVCSKAVTEHLFHFENYCSFKLVYGFLSCTGKKKQAVHTSVRLLMTTASWEQLQEVDPWNKMFQKERSAIHTLEYSFESYK